MGFNTLKNTSLEKLTVGFVRKRLAEPSPPLPLLKDVTASGISKDYGDGEGGINDEAFAAEPYTYDLHGLSPAPGELSKLLL